MSFFVINGRESSSRMFDSFLGGSLSLCFAFSSLAYCTLLIDADTEALWAFRVSLFPDSRFEHYFLGLFVLFRPNRSTFSFSSFILSSFW